MPLSELREKNSYLITGLVTDRDLVSAAADWNTASSARWGFQAPTPSESKLDGLREGKTSFDI
jgi:hypothetical protein